MRFMWSEENMLLKLFHWLALLPVNVGKLKFEDEINKPNLKIAAVIP